MGDRSSRRLDALNRSINRTLDQIEGHTKDGLSTSTTRANQRSGKSGMLAKGSSGKAPRMTQKQRAAYPISKSSTIQNKLTEPLSVAVKSSTDGSRIWSKQCTSPESRFQARYKLTEAGGYEEESAQDVALSEFQLLEVQMGDLKTVTGDQLIQTRSMTDCTSIVLLTDFDPDKKIYGKRSLVHIQGSSLTCMEEPAKIADTLYALAKSSNGRPLMILAPGIHTSSWLIETIAIPVELDSTTGVVQQPIVELMALCDVKTFPLTLDITVWPDGSLIATHVYSMRDSWGNGDKQSPAS